VNARVIADANLPPLPRVGLRMALRGGFERMTWYGRGAHECYADRKMSAHTGLYAKSVDELYTPYIFPQENGTRCDVQWAALTDDQGRGLLVVGMPLLYVNAQHHSVEELDAARHTNELVRRGEISVCLDYLHMGVGGDDSWSRCTHEEYLIQPGRFEYTLRLRPLCGKHDNPAQLARTKIEGVV